MRVILIFQPAISIGMVWNLDLFWQHWQNPLSGLLARFAKQGDPQRARQRARQRAWEAAWRRDPLSHPDLQAMSQRALDDLPFDPRAFSDD